ncbi:matrixin family metalloprotease [Dactylosporangium salmoneum]|uniref:matrixin family metalloprotease n=1 Tax=Dactylosporangium salmoneum TaxID=53361 RepID=UPI0031DDA3B1
MTAAVAIAAAAAGLGPVGANAANAADVPVDAAVTSVVQNADGTITETSYTPAPGVSPADLAQRLRSRGLNAKAGTQATASLAAASACSKGTARTWPSSATCFVRWSYNGAVRPVIDFVDGSGASWPVGRSVTKWNQTSGIDSIYRTSTAGCDGAPAHCVHVYSYNYGDTGWTGNTSRTLNSAQTYYTQAVTELNDYYGGTEAQKWNTACHELGHVLGLDHNTSTTSCLYYARTSQQYPNSDDYSLLESYY